MKYAVSFFLLCLIAACSSPSKVLLKTWKIDDVQFLDSLNTFTPDQKEMVTKSLKTDLNFTFLPDSAYVVKSAGTTINSKWWYTGKKKNYTLYTIGSDGKTVKSKIIKLTKDYFQFEAKADDENQSFLFTCSPVVTGSK